MRYDDRFAVEMPQLRRYARFLTRDVSAAEDLMQDCLVQGVSKLHLWKEGSNLRAWLSTILYHEYVNQVRRSARERAILGELERESDSSYTANQETRIELLDLSRAIDRIPAPQREVLLQAGIAGLRTIEIAEIFGIPETTVRTRLFRGRARLHLELEEPKSPRRKRQRGSKRSGRGVDIRRRQLGR